MHRLGANTVVAIDLVLRKDAADHHWFYSESMLTLALGVLVDKKVFSTNSVDMFKMAYKSRLMIICATPEHSAIVRI